MEELVINPDEKAIEAGQLWQQQADVASYEPPKLADIASQGRLYLLAEGFSGAAGGDAAARYAVQKTLHAYFTSLLTNPRERLLAAVRHANREIFERNQLHSTRRPLAATFTAALIHNSRLLVANSGDNRAYVVWDQDIEQLTADNANPDHTDDSPVRVIEPSGKQPEEKPAPTSFGGQLPRGLGLESEPAIEVFARRLFAGDVVVVVSGSLTGYIEPKEIARAVNLHAPETAIRRLLALAVERGHRDRCALSIIRVTSDPIDKRPPITAALPVAPTWAEVSQPRPPAPKEVDKDTRPMSGTAPLEPAADKPKFTRPPNFMPDASRRQINPRLIAVLAIVVALLLCSGLFVAARTLLPADMLAQLPMASSLGLVDAPAGDGPQVVRLPSPTPLVTPTSTTSAAAQMTLVAESAGSSPVGTPTTAAQSGSSFSSPVGTPERSAADTVTQPATPSPTPSPQPTIELPPGCENRGRFVTDITIPDGTQLAPGEQFDKAWRVNNANTCPWGPGYTIRFLEGDPMGAAAILPLTIIVPPEEDGEIRVSLTAPTQPGEYEATWQLHDLSGQPFGPELYLDIVVTPAVLAQGDAAQVNTLFDFVASADAAEWVSGDSTYSVLRSPISDTMELPRPEGLVAVGPAQLRGNLESPADALLTYPHLENGFIEGRYQIDTPLQPTDTFAAELGFTKLSILSDDGVTFEVTFTPDVGEEVTLFSSLVEYGDSPVTQIVPLADIAPDSTGVVTLRVLGGASLNQDWALWINARLVRP